MTNQQPQRTVPIEGPETDPHLTHIERINRAPPGTINPAHIPGLDYVPPGGKGAEYPKD